MRKLLFLFMLICTMQLHGQTVREWMGLPPVPVEFPAFGDMKNVENKTFSQADLLTLSTFNIENLTPAVGEQELQYHSLTWESATVNDNIVISQNKSTVPAIGLYAVYAENTQALAFYKRQGFTVTREQTDEQTGRQEFTMKYQRGA